MALYSLNHLRASGAPVISGALQFLCGSGRRALPEKIAEHLALADKARVGGDTLRTPTFEDKRGSRGVDAPSEPTDEEIHGIDVLSIEDAVRALWKRGIFAESAMGCTGPVVKVPGRVLAEAEEALRSEGFI
jgi:betaine reductase